MGISEWMISMCMDMELHITMQNQVEYQIPHSKSSTKVGPKQK